MLNYAQPIDYKALSMAMLQQMKQYDLEGLKHTQPTGTPTTTYGHGATGLFSTPGVEPDVYSALPMPLRGLLAQLPWFQSRYTNPLFSIVTGQTASTGSEKTNVCDDAPVVGLLKVCLQTAVFGRWERETREFELNRLGQLRDNADPQNLQLVNNPFMQGFGRLVPEAPGGMGNPLRSEIDKIKTELMIGFARDHARQIYTGDPANNTAGGGYQELVGLDIQINTGKVDAIANVACPAADSFIFNHNYGLIGSSPDIVNVFVATARALQQNADITGLSPVKWVIAMRPQLFYELTRVWPCSYYTNGCLSTTTSNNGVIDLRESIALRDSMRAESYLLIDGVQWPVVQDMAIVEENEGSVAAINSGQFASDAYFIPVTALGGSKTTTYMEYYDQNNPEAQKALGEMRLNPFFWTTNGGAILWTAKPPRNWCVQWQIKMEPRLILRTPFLAARITNIRYEPLRHDREVFPNDPYYTNGGQTVRPNGASYYTDWGIGTGSPKLS